MGTVDRHKEGSIRGVEVGSHGLPVTGAPTNGEGGVSPSNNSCRPSPTTRSYTCPPLFFFVALFVAEHEHPADRCPARDPQMGAMLLMHLSEANAEKLGITIQGKAVADHLHRLYLILEAPSEKSVHQFMAPFAQAGSVKVLPASSCERVVERRGCDA